jgi:hypothetical protein
MNFRSSLIFSIRDLLLVREAELPDGGSQAELGNQISR